MKSTSQVMASSQASAQMSINPHVAVPFKISHEEDFLDLRNAMQMNFEHNLAQYKNIFTTDATGMWESYLRPFRVGNGERQYYNCNACKSFIEKYGNLAFIDENGQVKSAIWDQASTPSEYTKSFRKLNKIVSMSKVTGVFYSSEKSWGMPKTGKWTHFALKNPKTNIHSNPVQSAEQKMAEKKEDFKNIKRTLAEFSIEKVRQAVAILDSNSLYRGEKTLGQAKWLLKVFEARGKNNQIWKLVAEAPAGFCHPRSSMIGTLLEDLHDGRSISVVEKRFAEKMNPTKYQRPVSAPKAGTVDQAEKLIETLKASGSLKRRFLKKSEIKAIWKPMVVTAKKDKGVFGYLKNETKTSTPVRTGSAPKKITWERFNKDVLPKAEKIEYWTGNNDRYGVLLTAEEKNSTPILQWDNPKKRNPTSWYFWRSHNYNHYGIGYNNWVNVYAVSLKPCFWNAVGDEFDHQGKAVMLMLEGAKESRKALLALFPECLRSEFHGVRSVIEAYSNTNNVAFPAYDHCVGKFIQKGDESETRVRVTSKGFVTEYIIDRWE
jgi:hypothetical protein